MGRTLICCFFFFFRNFFFSLFIRAVLISSPVSSRSFGAFKSRRFVFAAAAAAVNNVPPPPPPTVPFRRSRAVYTGQQSTSAAAEHRGVNVTNRVRYRNTGRGVRRACKRKQTDVTSPVENRSIVPGCRTGMWRSTEETVSATTAVTTVRRTTLLSTVT